MGASLLALAHSIYYIIALPSVYSSNLDWYSENLRVRNYIFEV